MFYILNYTLRLYFRNVKVINKPPKYGKTIYVSNHAASFMDPLVIAAFNRSVVYFMTRSDVFTSFTKPIFWVAHMLPIYRQRDGVNTKEKNIEVFKKCTETLLRNRNLLIFGEGFTDDTFIRRLKPIKKGAVRIGFTTLEACNWEEDIYIAALGCNYSDPSRFGSDLLIKNSKPIHLNQYQSEYQKNPSKVISEVTNLIEGLLKEELTHVEEIENAEYHEKIMMLERKGMFDSFSNHPELRARWEYSSSLAKRINESKLKITSELKNSIDAYFQKLKEIKTSDDLFYDSINNRFKPIDFFIQLSLAPFSILGFAHCALFYFLIKRFVEKKFRRDVFWGSTKLMMMIFIAGNINLGIFIFLPDLIGWPLSILYFLLIPMFGYSFYISMRFWQRVLLVSEIKRKDHKNLIKERADLKQKINNFVES